MCTDMLSFIYNPPPKKLGGSQTPILAHFAFQLAHCASLVPDRGPVINIVGWEALGSNPVINGVARQ